MNKSAITTLENIEQPIKWLLVDIGEVLLLKDGKKSFSELLADELAINIELAKEINRAHYTTMDVKFIPEQEFVATLKKNLGYAAPDDIFSYFSKAYQKQVRPNFELLNFLKEMRLRGVKTAILSNTIAIYAQIQEQAGISKKDGFDPILYSWEVEKLKPNKDIFELAVSRLQAKPEEIVFIDDKVEHIKGAQRVGLKTILFDDTENVISKLQNLHAIERNNRIGEKE